MNKTRELIVLTGLKLFKERGYEKVTIDDICDACGISSKTTFYYHLKSKEDIFVLWAEHVSSSIQEILLDYYDVVEDSQDYWDRLLVFYNTITVQEHLEEDAALFSHILSANLRADLGYLSFSKLLSRIGAELLRGAQRTNQIRNQSSADELYKTIYFAIIGNEYAWCVKRGSYDRFLQVSLLLESICDVVPEYRMANKNPDVSDKLVFWFQGEEEGE